MWTDKSFFRQVSDKHLDLFSNSAYYVNKWHILWLTQPLWILWNVLWFQFGLYGEYERHRELLFIGFASILVVRELLPVWVSQRRLTLVF